MMVAAAYAAVNRDPDLIPKNEKSPLDHLGPIRAGKSKFGLCKQLFCSHGFLGCSRFKYLCKAAMQLRFKPHV